MISAIGTIISSPIIWYLLTITTTSAQDFVLQILAIAIPAITGGGIFFWMIDTQLKDPKVRTTIFGMLFI